jgi:hypothetical protein
MEGGLLLEEFQLSFIGLGGCTIVIRNLIPIKNWKDKRVEFHADNNRHPPSLSIRPLNTTSWGLLVEGTKT